MLTAVTNILRERELLRPGEQPGFNITLVTEHVANVGAFAGDGASFHIKIKEGGTFPAEYENYCNASKAFPRHVPEPLGRYFRDGREVLIFRGVRHHPVSAGSVHRNTRGLTGEIVRFFEDSDKGARIAQPDEAHATSLRRIQERATDPAHAMIVGKWIVSGRLEGLPHIRQHGDLVLNNLGWTGAGLAVFDWEDFGRITLPGLDLCTLLASDARMDAGKLRAIMDGGDRRPDDCADLLDRSCPVIGLTPELFRQLIPLYLVIFLDLKRDYGKAIGQVVGRLIDDILGP